MKQQDLSFIIDALREALYHIELYKEDGWEDVSELLHDALRAAGDLEDSGFAEGAFDFYGDSE